MAPRSLAAKFTAKNVVVLPLKERAQWPSIKLPDGRTVTYNKRMANDMGLYYRCSKHREEKCRFKINRLFLIIGKMPNTCKPVNVAEPIKLKETDSRHECDCAASQGKCPMANQKLLVEEAIDLELTFLLPVL